MNEDTERRIEAAYQVMCSLDGAAPGRWGFFAEAPFPDSIYPCAGGFSWFHSQDELLSFLGEHILFLMASASQQDPILLIPAVQAVVRDIQSEETSLAEGILAFNTITCEFSEIQWCGSLESLLDSSSADAVVIREGFWEHHTDKESKAAIPLDRVEDFVDFITCIWGH